MINLVIVARSNVLTIAPKNEQDTEAWSDVHERLLYNIYAGGKARLLQIDPTDISEYYFEVDVQPGSTEYLTIIETAIKDFNGYMHDCNFKMFIGSNAPVI
jgi:hypothetical protein